MTVIVNFILLNHIIIYIHLIIKCFVQNDNFQPEDKHYIYR